MIYRDDIREISDYGEMVRLSTFLERVEEVLIKNRIAFEPDYMNNEYIHLDKAMEILYSLKNMK